jgi:hypothetical protein
MYIILCNILEASPNKLKIAATRLKLNSPKIPQLIAPIITNNNDNLSIILNLYNSFPPIYINLVKLYYNKFKLELKFILKI